MSNDNGPRFPKGRYKACGVAGGLGEASNGREQVAVEFEVLEGDFAGERITWYGYFGDDPGKGKKTPTEITVEALRNCGWQGDDLSDLRGIDANEVSLVIDHEEYQGSTQAKVKFVNRLGGLALKAPMSPDKAKAFAARMKGKIVAASKSAGQAPTQRNGGGAHPNAPGTREDGPPREDDIPF